MGAWGQNLPWIGAAAGLALAAIEYVVLGYVAQTLAARHPGDAAVQRPADGPPQVRLIELLRKANFVIMPLLGFAIGWVMRG